MGRLCFRGRGSGRLICRVGKMTRLQMIKTVTVVKVLRSLGVLVQVQVVMVEVAVEVLGPVSMVVLPPLVRGRVQVRLEAVGVRQVVEVHFYKRVGV